MVNDEELHTPLCNPAHFARTRPSYDRVFSRYARVNEKAEKRKPHPTPRERVLVVEDSLTTASVVKYFLELEGFEVLLAEDGLLGLEVAVRERPDVIVTDLKMPGMDGVEMVKALRADARTSQIRILMLTSDSSKEGVKEGLAAGADDYLLKPVYPRLLAARVKALRARPRPEAQD